MRTAAGLDGNGLQAEHPSLMRRHSGVYSVIARAGSLVHSAVTQLSHTSLAIHWQQN